MLESLQLSSFPHPTKPTKTHPTKKPNSVSMALLSQCLPGQPRPLPFSQAKRRTTPVHASPRTTGTKRSSLSTCRASSSSSSSPSGSGQPRSIPFSQAKRRTPLVHASPRTTGTKRSSLSTCLASSSSSPSGSMGSNLVELPIFPLPLVLFPGAMLPLQIFEFRYRIMMHTLLQTDLRFGVLFSNPMPSSTDPSSGLVEVGCVAEVVKHQRLVDDRFFLICKGQERFRISHVLRTKPYMVAAVSWLEDRPPPDPAQGDDLEKLASEVEGYMKDVIRISNRLEGKKQDSQKPDVDLRKGQFPTPFSFFVASTFEGAPREQQVLLELEDTAARLKRERDTLKSTLNYLTAASAVKDAFPSSP